MVRKSERFEMRLDEDTLARIDKWRSSLVDVPSRAEAMRRLIEFGLSRGSDSSVKISDGEKVIILMLRDMSRHLKVANPEVNPDFMGKVIQGGHYWAPKREMPFLLHDHTDDPRDVAFVLDVLEMWQFIEVGYSRLAKQDRQRLEKEAAPFGKKVAFWGFDGNCESAHLSIAGFFIRDMGRFERFQKRSLNSSMPTTEIYSRMLRVFEPIHNSILADNLDANQIISLLKAIKPPESGH